MNRTEPDPADQRQLHIVSVRRLVEFVLTAGDITPGGFQRRDRAQLGTQGDVQFVDPFAVGSKTRWFFSIRWKLNF